LIALTSSASVVLGGCEDPTGLNREPPKLVQVHVAGEARLSDGTPVPSCRVDVEVSWWASTGSGWFEGEIREVHYRSTTDRDGRYQISYESVCGTNSFASLSLTPPSGFEIAHLPGGRLSPCMADLQVFDFVLRPVAVTP